MRYILFFTLLLFSCKPDNSPASVIDGNSLVGEWEVFHATRNGKVTKSADKSFITFEADNIIKSNLFTNDNSHTFTFKKGKIELNEEEVVKFFKVKDLRSDTLILETKVQSFKMEFSLKKKNSAN